MDEGLACYLIFKSDFWEIELLIKQGNSSLFAYLRTDYFT